MLIRSLTPLLIIPATAMADVPRVMTDIAPVHSLTAQVMGDLGAPDLLLPPGADPHDFALRPSDAENLGAADLVIWVGHGLTPWLEEPLETLAGGATHLSLLETDGWDTLDIRELEEIAAEGDHDHGHDDKEDGHDGHDHDDHAEEGHDDHDEHAHEDDHGEEDHAEDADHDHDHAHDHGDFDPHAWTDPAIAQVWLGHIADALATADPDNAATYRANAATAQDAILAADARLSVQLSELSDRAYVLPHDGYQYFEVRYGLNAAGALSATDGSTPGPAQVAELREHMAEDGIVCVFSDTAIGDRWAAILTEGNDARTAPLDAVGVGLEAGPALYGQMIDRLGAAFVVCLGGEN